jgi:nitrite reductase (NO-forming)
MEEEQKQGNYGKRPLWQWLVLYLVIAVVVYGAVYYFILAKNGNGYNNSAVTPTYTSPTITQLAPSSTSAAVMQKITVSGSEFAFTPSTLTFKKGQPAEITFKNNGTYPHNLTIADLNVKTKTISPGEQDTIQFTPDKTGQFAFLCTVPGHADKGMKGTLTVQ